MNFLNFSVLNSFFFEKQIKNWGRGSRNGFYIKLFGSVSTDLCLSGSVPGIFYGADPSRFSKFCYQLSILKGTEWFFYAIRNKN